MTARGGSVAMRGTRIAMLWIALLPAGIAAVVVSIPASSGSTAVVAPAIVAGLISPAAAVHTYQRALRRAAASEDRGRRVDRLAAGTLQAVAISGAVALIGIAAYLASGLLPALVGVVTHLLATGAVWPSRSRIERILDEAD